MGIDAQMLVKTRTHLSEKEVRRLAVALAEAFGHERFWIWEDFDPPRHALEIVTQYEQDGPTLRPKRGEQFIEVHIATRYYGPDYERGDLSLIKGVAEWLEVRIPGCDIWYGGDSSGVKATRFDKAARDELWLHFCEHGHRPYRGFFGEGRGTQPLCGFCDYGMNNYGGGRGDSFFGCDGCGKKAIRRDSTGATFLLKRGEDFFEGHRRAEAEWTVVSR